MEQEQFIDIQLTEKNGRMDLCYRSGLLVYEETLDEGIFHPVYWNAAGFPSATCAIDLPFSEVPPRMQKKDYPVPQAFRLEKAGEDLQAGWLWGGLEKKEEEKGLHGIVTLYHERAGITVHVHTLLDGTSVLTRWLTVENTGDAAAPIGHISVMSGAMQTTVRQDKLLSEGGALYTVGYMKDSCWSSEGNFIWRDLPNAELAIYGRGRRERHRHPMYLLRNNATGECFITQFAWSGSYAFTFDLDDEYDIRGIPTDYLTHAVTIDTPSPSRILAAGETFDTPAVHTGMLFGSTDDAVNEMHRHVRKTVLSRRAKERSGWVEAWLGVDYGQNDMENIYARVDRAAGLGAEVFFIDAGWYTPLYKEGEWRYLVGDWEIGEGRFPEGFGELIDYVHSKGMLWGLWMDPERIGWDSAMYKAHPEYHALGKTGKPGAEGMVRVSDPALCDWMEKRIRHLLDDYHCDFYRLDFNIGDADADSYTLRDGVMEQDQLRYYENLYAMYERLRKDYPDVIFENCAGGGGRTDLGMMANFDHTWISDWQLMPRSFRILNGMTMALPPEICDRMVGEMEGFLRGDLATQLRIAMFVRPTLGPIGGPMGWRINDKQMAVVRHHIDLYKEFVRPFQNTANVFHHTPETVGAEPQGFGALELTAEDSSCGMAAVFRLSGIAEDTYTIALRGVDPAKDYEVTFDNSGAVCRLSGFALSQGVKVRLEGQLTSELILYRAM